MKGSFLFYFDIDVVALKRKGFISCKLILPQLVFLVLLFNVSFQFDDGLDIPYVVASVLDLVVNKLKNLSCLTFKYLVQECLYPETWNPHIYSLH